MEILWSIGEASVQDVVHRLDRSLAYTTVMTTLDRLFKKGLLKRQKEKHAFRYTPKFTRTELEQQDARDWFTGFLTSSSDTDLLLSSLVDAVRKQDSAWLDELERKIILKRKQIQGGASSGDT